MIETNKMEQPPQIEQPDQMKQIQMEHPTQTMEESQVRRSTRVRQSLMMYFSNKYVNLTGDEEPQIFQEAIEIDDKEKWMQTMKEEMQSLIENQIYDLMELPEGRKAFKNKWVFKLKNEENLNPTYKARIMVKGCNQKKGIYFEEIFSPVVKMTSIREILCLAVKQDLEVEKLDVKTTFLHGNSEKEIYMEQP